MGELILYHGSTQIIEKPQFGMGKLWNDYGQGFYCTQNINLAMEWACPTDADGFANCYELKTDNLNILNLQKDEYTTLHWLSLLVQNRKFDLDTPVIRKGFNYLQKNFLIDLKDYDAVIGYRADDSYFSFAKAFLSNTISYEQLQMAIKFGNLGEQFVLKSEKSFKLLTFKDFKIADGKIYSQLRKKRDSQARNQYKELLEKSDISGLFIRDMILQEVKSDDARLR